MIQRVLSVECLAEKCGIAVVTLRNQMALNFPSRRLRMVVEDVLGLPIWTTLVKFDSRQKLSALCGFDPLTASVPELRKKLSALKIRGRSGSHKKGVLIQMLEAHLTKQTNNQNNRP